MSIAVNLPTEMSTSGTALEGAFSPRFDASTLGSFAVSPAAQFAFSPSATSSDNESESDVASSSSSLGSSAESAPEVATVSTSASDSALPEPESTSSVATITTVQNIAGTWASFNGTEVVINASNSSGDFTGTFTSGSHSTYPAGTYSLIGRQDTLSKVPAFSFSVMWGSINSSTAFSGQYNTSPALEVSWVRYSTKSSGDDSFVPR